MSRVRDVSDLCGELLVTGFPGPSLDEETARALREKRRAGVILFRRNVESVDSVYALTKELLASAPTDPFISVDQEGGRVMRIPPPAIQLPPMRAIGGLGRPDLAERAGAILAAELRSMGINVTFAPVLDVDSNPANPVIGDRAFGADPELVAEMGCRFIEGVQGRGVLACGKHFPGHGDTSKDSHFDLPALAHPRERIERIELVPFRRAAAVVGAFMSAHVVYEGLDPGVPATLSPVIATDLLRRQLGFGGVLFSDDLEMKAIADRYGIEDAAVQAVRAGCDVLLICKDMALADQAHAALVREAEADEHFRARCHEAAERSRAARRRFPCRPAPSLAEMHRIIDESGARDLLADL